VDLPRDLQAVVEALVGRLELTSAEVASAGGIDLEQTRRLWRALGFPPVPDDARIFTAADRDVLTTIRRLLDDQRIDATVLIQLARVTGRSLASIADAQIDAAEAALREAPGTLAPFVGDLERLLTYVWRRQLLAALLRRTARPSDAGDTVAVGFADLVGFTVLSQGLDARDLAAMVDRFEAIAYEHIPHHGGRVIKMIGDEVMFAVDDAVAAAEIGLALVEAHAQARELPDVRVGLARGPALAWDGDLFGPTVNLASRLVNVARPASVLLSESLGEELQGRPEYGLRHLRPVRLQGIGRVRSWVLRRNEEPKSRRGRRARVG
jgi:adenylate cyclase